MRKTLLLITLAAACGPPGPVRDDGPPPLTVAPVAGEQLADVLARLDRELVGAMEGRLEGESLDNFVRAEAITDRLLETQFPFEWLRAENYSLQSKLRQIQALSDRILAQVRSGGSRDTAYYDLAFLRRSVVELRQTIAQGGGAAPPPLERLLAGRDTTDEQAPEGPGGE